MATGFRMQMLSDGEIRNIIFLTLDYTPLPKKLFKLFTGLFFYRYFLNMETSLPVFSHLSGCFFISEIRLNPDKEKFKQLLKLKIQPLHPKPQRLKNQKNA